MQQLPRVDRHVELLHATNSTIFLEPDVLLAPDHPLTTPKLETYMLLQMFVYTAYQLAGLGHSISIVNVAKLRFFADEDEQLALLQKILHSLASNGKRDEQQWQFNYYKLMWLWNWNIEIDEGALRGAGVFGKIDKATIEKELLKVLIASGRKHFTSYRTNLSRKDPIHDLITQFANMASSQATRSLTKYTWMNPKNRPGESLPTKYS